MLWYPMLNRFALALLVTGAVSISPIRPSMADDFSLREPIEPEDFNFHKVVVRADERPGWAIEFTRVDIENGKATACGTQEHRENFGGYRKTILHGSTHVFDPNPPLKYLVKDGLVGRAPYEFQGRSSAAHYPLKSDIPETFTDVTRLKLPDCVKPGPVEIRWYIRRVDISDSLKRNDSYKEIVKIRATGNPAAQFAESSPLDKADLKALIESVERELESARKDKDAKNK